MENRVSQEVPDEVLTQVLTKLNEAEALLKPFAVEMTPGQLLTLPKMADKSVPFVEKVMMYLESNPDYAPPFVKKEDLGVDLNVFEGLSPIVNATSRFSETVNNLRQVAGSEAYIAALSYYNSVKQAAKLALPGAAIIADDLAKRFETTGPKKNKETV